VTVDDTGNINLPTNGNITVNSVNQKRTIVLTAAGATIPVANNATVSQLTTTTNLDNFMTLDFIDAAIKYAEWTIVMPGNYSPGTSLDVQFVWTATSGAGNTVWGISAYAVRDNISLDRAQTMTDLAADPYHAAQYAHVTPVGSVAISNSPVAGDVVQVKACREGTAALDTFTGTSKLMMIILKYTTNKLSD
jgi:hypothetical protein